MTRILVTGTAGALGNALVQMLNKNKQLKIFTTARQELAYPNHITIDLCKSASINYLLKRSEPDYIYHLAASLRNNMDEAYYFNVKPAQEMLEFIKVNRLKTKIILIGSAAEYGLVNENDNPIDESLMLRPITPYGISKAWQSQLVAGYANLGVDVTCARIFNIYGKGISRYLLPGYLNCQIQSVLEGRQDKIQLGSLNAVRDYISIDDAVKQIKNIAHYGKKGEIYHVGSGNPTVIKDFVEKILHKNNLDLSLIEENKQSDQANYPRTSVVYANMNKTNNLICKQPVL